MSRCEGQTQKRTQCTKTATHDSRCWQHLTPAEREAVQQARDAAEAARYRELCEIDPACWSWPVTDEIRELLRRSEDEALPFREQIRARIAAEKAYDQGRCAICGVGGEGGRIEDHCHWTGRTRGMLCAGCNVREAKYPDPRTVFGKYRNRYPYMILGLDEPYTGYGWENGEPIGGWWPGWGEPPPTSVDMWANHPMRGAL